MRIDLLKKGGCVSNTFEEPDELGEPFDLYGEAVVDKARVNASTEVVDLPPEDDDDPLLGFV